MPEIEIYREALRRWGPEAQMLMAFEEMSELQKELCKAARGKQNKAEIAEEIADVQIMLGRMRSRNRKPGSWSASKGGSWRRRKQNERGKGVLRDLQVAPARKHYRRVGVRKR